MMMVIMLIGGGAIILAENPPADLEARIKQLEAQIAAQQAQITAQQAVLEELKHAVQSQPQPQPKTTETAALSADAKKAIQEIADKAVAAEMKKTNLNGWKFGGDIRVRYDGLFYDESAIPDRNQYRLRTRFGVTKNFGHGLSGGFRLATGIGKPVAGQELGSPAATTNQNLGDSFDRKGIWLDLAYIAWTPDIEGQFLTFGCGKFANPFVSTPLLWDTDVNPEGFYEKLSHKFGAVEPFVTVGETILKENTLKADSYMIGGQGGVNITAKKVGLTLAAAYYDYVRYDTNYKYTNGNTVSTVGGNLVLDAGDFNLLNLLAQVRTDAWRFPVEFFTDYVRNLEASGPYGDKDTAWSAGGQIGKNKARKDWLVLYRYAYIAPNAVIGAFADSEFGYANRKGSEIRFRYNLMDPLTFGSSLFLTKPVVELLRDSGTRFQLEVEYKF